MIAVAPSPPDPAFQRAGPTAIHQQRDAGCERGVVRQQEHDRGDHLIDMAEPPDGLHRSELVSCASSPTKRSTIGVAVKAGATAFTRTPAAELEVRSCDGRCPLRLPSTESARRRQLGAKAVISARPMEE